MIETWGFREDIKDVKDINKIMDDNNNNNINKDNDSNYNKIFVFKSFKYHRFCPKNLPENTFFVPIFFQKTPFFEILRINGPILELGSC